MAGSGPEGSQAGPAACQEAWHPPPPAGRAPPAARRTWWRSVACSLALMLATSACTRSSDPLAPTSSCSSCSLAWIRAAACAGVAGHGLRAGRRAARHARRRPRKPCYWVAPAARHPANRLSHLQLLGVHVHGGLLPALGAGLAGVGVQLHGGVGCERGAGGGPIGGRRQPIEARAGVHEGSGGRARQPAGRPLTLCQPRRSPGLRLGEHAQRLLLGALLAVADLIQQPLQRQPALPHRKVRGAAVGRGGGQAAGAEEVAGADEGVRGAPGAREGAQEAHGRAAGAGVGVSDRWRGGLRAAEPDRKLLGAATGVCAARIGGPGDDQAGGLQNLGGGAVGDPSRDGGWGRTRAKSRQGGTTRTKARKNTSSTTPAAARRALLVGFY